MVRQTIWLLKWYLVIWMCDLWACISQTSFYSFGYARSLQMSHQRNLPTDTCYLFKRIVDDDWTLFVDMSNKKTKSRQTFTTQNSKWAECIGRRKVRYWSSFLRSFENHQKLMKFMPHISMTSCSELLSSYLFLKSKTAHTTAKRALELNRLLKWLLNARKQREFQHKLNLWRRNSSHHKREGSPSSNQVSSLSSKILTSYWVQTSSFKMRCP